MKNPDDFILDCIVQPVVDRLPETVSCFDVARVCLVGFAVGDLATNLNRYLMEKSDLRLTVFYCAITPIYYYCILRRVINGPETHTKANPQAMNPARIDFFAVFISWMWVNILAGYIGHDGLAFTTSAFMVCSLFFARANPRPPGKQRKAWLPSILALVPQGAV